MLAGALPRALQRGRKNGGSVRQNAPRSTHTHCSIAAHRVLVGEHVSTSQAPIDIDSPCFLGIFLCCVIVRARASRSTAYFCFPPHTLLSFSRCAVLISRTRLGRSYRHVYICRSRSTHAPTLPLPYPFDQLPRSGPSRAHSPAQHVRELLLLLLQKKGAIYKHKPFFQACTLSLSRYREHQTRQHHTHPSLPRQHRRPWCPPPPPSLPPLTLPIDCVSSTFLRHRQPQTLFPCRLT